MTPTVTPTVTPSARPTIALLRPREHIPKSTRYARENGFEVISAPMVEVRPLQVSDLEARIQWATWVVFTSPNGIKHANKLTNLPKLLRKRKVAAIGPKTAAALRGIGVSVDVIPERYSSEGLAHALHDQVEGENVQVVRSAHGRLALLKLLGEAGARVRETPVYELVRPDYREQEVLLRALLDGRVDAIAFTSSLTAENLLGLAREHDREAGVREALNNMVVGAIGPPTAETLRGRGVEVDAVPEEYTFNELIDEIKRRNED